MRDIGADVQSHIRKFLPMLRLPIPGLVKCADWMEQWLDDTLPPLKLLDVSAWLGPLSENLGDIVLTRSCPDCGELHFMNEVHDTQWSSLSRAWRRGA